MGKACIRFKRVDDLPIDLVGKAVAMTSVDSYIEIYETARAKTSKPVKRSK